MSPESGSTSLRFHHVGVACRNLAPAIEFVRSAHHIVEETAVVYDPLQDADLCLLRDDSGLGIELVAGPAVAGLLKRGHSYYHLCHEVDDLAAGIQDLSARGCRLVRPPSPAVLFDGREVCFLLSPIGLVELLAAQ